MAIIGSIRKRSFLLLLVIGLAMLAFILGDIFSNRGPGSGGMLSVGEINGVQVDASELDARTSYWSDMYSQNYNQQISRDQARNIAWQDMLKEKVLMKEIASTGLSFTEEEFDDVRYGEGVVDEFLNNYKDETGQFSKEKVLQTYNYLYNDNRNVWSAEKKRLQENRLTLKYNNMISKSIIATDLEAKDVYAGNGSSVDLKYVMKKYTDITDDEIEVSESDLRTFFNAHKDGAKYKQIASRDMEILSFPVVATADDKAGILEEVSNQIVDFRNTLNDSTFILSRSDNRMYVKLDKTREQLDTTISSQVFNSQVGAVVGPYQEGNTFKLLKVVGTDNKDEATVRHILLKSDISNDAVVKIKADSLKNAIRRGADFEEMVNQFTEDPGSKATGGKYEWFPKGQMVPEFEDFSFNSSKGSLGVVKTTYGYHIIEVLDKRSTAVRQVVELTKKIVPSSQTFDKIYQQANAFVIDNSGSDNFEAGAEALGMKIKPAKGVAAQVSNVAGINNAKEVVRWSYETTRAVGDVSTPLEVGEQFVVARLTGSREDGLPVFEDVQDKMRPAVLKDKKAKQIIASLGSYSTLEAAAQAIGTSVQSANAVGFSTVTIPGAGREPEIVGTAFSLTEGDISTALQGEFGVYVIQLDAKNLSNVEGVDMSTDRSAAKNQSRSQVGVLMNRALNDARGVVSTMDRVY